MRRCELGALHEHVRQDLVEALHDDGALGWMGFFQHGQRCVCGRTSL